MNSPPQIQDLTSRNHQFSFRNLLFQLPWSHYFNLQIQNLTITNSGFKPYEFTILTSRMYYVHYTISISRVLPSRVYDFSTRSQDFNVTKLLFQSGCLNLTNSWFQLLNFMNWRLHYSNIAISRIHRFEFHLHNLTFTLSLFYNYFTNSRFDHWTNFRFHNFNTTMQDFLNLTMMHEFTIFRCWNSQCLKLQSNFTTSFFFLCILKMQEISSS